MFSSSSGARPGGADVITDFRPGTDQLVLQGYPATEKQALLNLEASSGALTLHLDDGTQITLLGVTHLSPGGIA